MLEAARARVIRKAEPYTHTPRRRAGGGKFVAYCPHTDCARHTTHSTRVSTRSIDRTTSDHPRGNPRMSLRS
eukprot:3236685-Prymnesium_polylepis.1